MPERLKLECATREVAQPEGSGRTRGVHGAGGQEQEQSERPAERSPTARFHRVSTSRRVRV